MTRVTLVTESTHCIPSRESEEDSMPWRKRGLTLREKRHQRHLRHLALEEFGAMRAILGRFLSDGAQRPALSRITRFDEVIDNE